MILPASKEEGKKLKKRSESVNEWFTVYTHVAPWDILIILYMSLTNCILIIKLKYSCPFPFSLCVFRYAVFNEDGTLAELKVV